MFAIVGICLVLQPWNDTFNPSLQAILLGYGMSFGAGFFLMLNVVIVSHYTFLQDPENQRTSMFWMLLLGIISSECMSLTHEKQVINCHWTDWLLVIGHSITYGLKIPLEMYVSSRLPGVVISVIMSTSIIYVFIAQYSFLAHIHSGYMNVTEICGIIIVTISSVLPSVVKAMTKKEDCSGE